jgi:hypothetical protein
MLKTIKSESSQDNLKSIDAFGILAKRRETKNINLIRKIL